MINEKNVNLVSSQECVENKSTQVLSALEMFFNNVMDCLIIDEKEFCFRG